MKPYEKENNDGERKQPMKKVISLMLALVLALSLTACGGKASGPEGVVSQFCKGLQELDEKAIAQCFENGDDLELSDLEDVDSDDAIEGLHELIGKLGGMDLYFHSSGIGWENCSLDAEKEMRTVQTNAVGFTRMVLSAYQWFADNAHRGRIACITSIARTRGLGAAPAYSATKRFQSHYLECLAQLASMRRLPIAITDIRPGFVATDLIAGSHFPLQLSAEHVAADIVSAVERGKKVVTIDWRYRLLVAAWRMIPRWAWIRLRFVE